jgi:hypothetical protein
MSKVYERTENGTTTTVSRVDGLAEINHAMMGGKRQVRQMSAGRTDAQITYRDGRTVTLTLVDAPEAERRIVTVKGKRYIVGSIVPARPKVEGAATWVPEAYVSYWSEQNGERFGATRSAKSSMRPGTVARAIWDAMASV